MAILVLLDILILILWYIVPIRLISVWRAIDQIRSQAPLNLRRWLSVRWRLIDIYLFFFVFQNVIFICDSWIYQRELISFVFVFMNKSISIWSFLNSQRSWVDRKRNIQFIFDRLGRWILFSFLVIEREKYLAFAFFSDHFVQINLHHFFLLVVVNKQFFKFQI